MRFYSISVDGAPAVFPVRYDYNAQWGTMLNGYHDPNAQQVEFQITALDTSTPSENSTITIYGVSWDQIVASNQLVDKTVTIDAGMSPGLPLATFQGRNAGLIMTANILKCWGNWIGNETSIGMLIAPTGIFSGTSDSSSSSSPSSDSSSSSSDSASPQAQSAQVNRTGLRSIDQRSLPVGRSAVNNNATASLGIGPAAIAQQIGGQIISDFDIGPATSQIGNIFGSFFGGGNFSPLSKPINLVHNLMPNMPLSSAIQETLSRAFPKASVNVAISSALKLAYQDAGMYQSLEQYAGYLNNLSQSIFGTKAYPGIRITTVDNRLDVWDGSKTIGSTVIDYKDLIGQPTWLDFNTVSIKIVMRGGLRPGMSITLPQTLINYAGGDSVTPGQSPNQRSHITLPGTYQIMKLTHIGDFRNPDGAAWSTNIEAALLDSVNAAAIPDTTQQQSVPVTSGDVNITVKPGQ